MSSTSSSDESLDHCHSPSIESWMSDRCYIYAQQLLKEYEKLIFGSFDVYSDEDIKNKFVAIETYNSRIIYYLDKTSSSHSMSIDDIKPIILNHIKLELAELKYEKENSIKNKDDVDMAELALHRLLIDTPHRFSRVIVYNHT